MPSAVEIPRVTLGGIIPAGTWAVTFSTRKMDEKLMDREWGLTPPKLLIKDRPIVVFREGDGFGGFNVWAQSKSILNLVSRDWEESTPKIRRLLSCL